MPYNPKDKGGMPRIRTDAALIPQGMERPTGKRRDRILKKPAKLMTLQDVPLGHVYRPYEDTMKSWFAQQLTVLVDHIGGGIVGPGPQAILALAARQFAASTFLHDMAVKDNDKDLFLQASRLGDSSRQNILAAHELCVREAQRRQAQEELSPHQMLAATIGVKP
jgi:hypothetical protein